jgi:CheY-like chemotaxis protein
MAAILVASSDGELRRLLAREVAEGGHQIHFAADAIETLMLLKARPPAVVVADTRLPSPGARPLIARIRAEPSAKYLPVLLIGEEGAAAPGSPDPATTFLPRPLSRLALAEALGPILDAARAPAGNAAEPVAGGAPAAASPEEWPLRVRRLCHDLNNPLAVVMGQAEMIADRHADLPADVARRLTEIRKAAEEMKALIRQAGVEAKEASPGRPEV